jgi:DNA-binding NtrC family response regulator
MTSAERAPSPSLAEMGQALEVVLQGMLNRSLSLAEAVRAFELRYVEAAMERYGGSIQQAAAALGVHRNTLRAKLRKRPRRVA